jgi:hypothetical protein
MAQQEAPEAHWEISTTKDWQAFIAQTDGFRIADGHAVAQKPQVSFTSQLKKFPEPIKLRDIELKPRFLLKMPCTPTSM